MGVTVLCPVFFQTDLLDSGRIANDVQRRIAAEYMQTARFTADDVARAAVDAMNRKKLYVIEGRKARIYWRIKHWIPTTFLKVVSRGYRRKKSRAQRQIEMESE